MELNNLKTGLWGFKKQDVCEYIAKMSEELTAKMEQERRQNEEKLDAIVQAMRREGCETDCAKALLPLAGELAVKAVRQLRQRRA